MNVLVVDAISVGFLLVITGVVIIFAGLWKSSDGNRQVKGGGVVLIGPIPIAFGTDAKWTSIAIALAIVLIMVVLLFQVL